jgi:hypothetical protein
MPSRGLGSSQDWLLKLSEAWWPATSRSGAATGFGPASFGLRIDGRTPPHAQPLTSQTIASSVRRIRVTSASCDRADPPHRWPQPRWRTPLELETTCRRSANLRARSRGSTHLRRETLLLVPLADSVDTSPLSAFVADLGTQALVFLRSIRRIGMIDLKTGVARRRREAAQSELTRAGCHDRQA